MTVARRTAGPASANLQGRKPREGVRGCRGVGFGDLSAAGEVCEWSRGAPAGRWTVKRLLDERRGASIGVDCRTGGGDGCVSERALQWPVQRRLGRRPECRG